MKRIFCFIALLIAVGAALYAFGMSRGEAIDEVERYVNELNSDLPARALDFAGDLQSVKLDRKAGKVMFTFTDVRDLERVEENEAAEDYLIIHTIKDELIESETLAKSHLSLEYIFQKAEGNTVTYTIKASRVAEVSREYGESTAASVYEDAPASYLSTPAY